MLFVVASATRVTYSVMVEISSDDIEWYWGILNIFFQRYLKWTLDWTIAFPSNQFTAEGLKQSGYDVDIHSIRVNFELWKSVLKLIRAKGQPLPPMKFLKPTGVCWWNCQKNPIDVLSRLLSNMKIPFGHAHPVLQLFVRFLFILFVNSYLVNNLVNVPIDGKLQYMIYSSLYLWIILTTFI